MTRKYFTCPHCHENSRIRTFAPDRVELEREKGERFSVRCAHCAQEVTRHVNEVKARANHLITYVVTAFCVLAWIMFFLYGLNLFILLAATSLVGLPMAVHRAVEKSAAVFNDYQLKETR